MKQPIRINKIFIHQEIEEGKYTACEQVKDHHSNNLYSIDGTMVASGLSNQIVKQSAQDFPWYDDLKISSNHQVLFFSGTDTASTAFGQRSETGTPSRGQPC